jgi:hypothetical protein
MCVFLTKRVLLSIALALVYGALPAMAHAILLSAVPESQSIVSGPSVRVRLQFNSRIDGKRSRFLLVLPDARERLITTSQPSSAVVTSEVSDLTPGIYVLRWQVLAQDGHITRGELPFRVK